VQIKAMPWTSNMWMQLSHGIRYEIVLSWQFIKNDISATIVPTTLFMIAAWNSSGGSVYDLATALGNGLIYFWLYVLTFCLSNQLVGIDEDRINKPNRPLVIGMVSYRGALLRWVAMMLLFSLLGWWLGLLRWALLWQAAIVLHNFGGWSKHWFGKHTLMGVGIVAGLAPAWELVLPLTAQAWRWILFFACAILPLIATQDLRDTCGDRAIGRRTFPIVFGEGPTRIMLSLGFMLLPIAMHTLLMRQLSDTWHTQLCSAILAGLSLLIAARLLLYRSCAADQRTYTLFTYWYCAGMFSAIVML
jgi:4-hydroxybenzoate polyprenyltransferase